ncbi:tetratricopeptide repeat protein [Lentzea aerocolonigenes]|uniref:tetratricopeptide repeat protein n=1 Tax=Lentzea aerocolonigenes TaxID=68170 RepID=UPI0006968F1C|nr:tetratricopeptide repeat protein [Lentzea aerocolonigenes]
MSKESRLAALHRALAAQAGQPVLFADLIRAVWGDDPPSGPLPALRSLVKRLRQSIDDEIVTDASGYRLVVRPPGPRQLPADLPDFVGRDEELAALSASNTPVLAITGPPGIGKTALAVRLAHRIRDRFPGGQLHVNLRGFAAGPAVTVEQALGRFLRSLGVSPANIPLDVGEQIELYRSKLRGRRVLVLLDNATELSPLVPDVDGCTAIVTSRNELAGQVRLDVLTDDEASTLLDRWQIDGSPQDRVELIKLCAHLPLALRIAGAHLADRHLSDYLADLRGDGRLDALEIEGDAAVQATFDLSYRALPERAQHLFRLLGQIPGADFGVEAATALLGEDATEPLGHLVHANLVQRAQDRHSLHDLLRAYALRLGAPEPTRLYEYYLVNADAAGRRLNPEVHRMELPRLPDDLPRHDMPDEPGALAWLDTERANVVAAVLAAGDQPITWQLADAMRAYFMHHAANAIEWRTAAQAGLQAAQHLGEVGAEANMLGSLGLAHWRSSQFTEALPKYARAVSLARQENDLDSLQPYLGNFGIIHWELGNLAEAAEAMRESLSIVRKPNTLFNLSCVLEDLGPLDLAVSCGEDALRMSVEQNLTAGVAICLHGLAVSHQFIGEFDEVERYLAEVEPLVTPELGPSFAASVLESRALLLFEQGRLAEAESVCRQALEVAASHEDELNQADAHSTLGSVLRQLSRLDEAVQQHHQALALSRKAGLARCEVQSLTALAADHRVLGNLAAALGFATEADKIAERGQLRVRQVPVVAELAEIHRANGDEAEAERCRRRALDLARVTGRKEWARRLIEVSAR